MNFTNTPDAQTNGTCLQGTIYTHYCTLVEKFGEPTFGTSTYGNDDKVTVEWVLEFEDGTVATIYDWKCRQTPGQYFWHVGGFDRRAVELVEGALNDE